MTNEIATSAINLETTDDIFQVIEKRRAIRKYKPYDIPDEDLKRILDSARLAPSANNSQPWRFIIIKDPKTKQLLAKPSTQPFIAGANAIIMVLGDPSGTSTCCPQSQTWITRDPIIAAEHIVLAATALGYGTCWIANYNSRPKEWEDEVRRTLKIPDHIHIVVLVAIGLPNENPSSRPRKSLQEITFAETYGNPVNY